MYDWSEEHQAIIAVVRRFVDEEVTPRDLVGKGLWEITPADRQQQIRDFFDAEDFFEDLAVIPGSQNVLQQLATRFEIFRTEEKNRGFRQFQILPKNNRQKNFAARRSFGSSLFDIRDKRERFFL